MGVFGDPRTETKKSETAPVKSYSIWCPRCKKMAGTQVGGVYKRVECGCEELDKAIIREKMGIAPGTPLPPWGDPLWGRVFASPSSGGGFGAAVARTVAELRIKPGDQTETPAAAAAPEPEPAPAPVPEEPAPEAEDLSTAQAEASVEAASETAQEPDFPEPEESA